MYEHRTKVCLTQWLKKKLSDLAPAEMNLSQDFEIEYLNEIDSGCVIGITDPMDRKLRRFEVKVIQKNR